MLFLQGTRDVLAQVDFLVPTVADLGPQATLHLVNDADHSFHVPARSGSTDATALASALDAMAVWVDRLQKPELSAWTRV